jgi:hypothetical protein
LGVPGARLLQQGPRTLFILKRQASTASFVVDVCLTLNNST